MITKNVNKSIIIRKQFVLLVIFFLLSPIQNFFLYAQEKVELKYVDASEFELIGKGFTNTKSLYERLPASLEERLRSNLWKESTNSSGLAIRFRSNSSVIAAKWEVTLNRVYNHMTPTATKGLDLYCLVDGKWKFVKPARPSTKNKKSSTIIIENLDPREREFMLYLPMYDGLISLEIGVETDAFIKNPGINSPRKEKPVVLYGTSVTQGACASRAGMQFSSQLSRMLDRQIINLGFNDQGRLDVEVAEVMADIDASCFIIDCLGNNGISKLPDKLTFFYNAIRSKNSKAPIVLVEQTYYTYTLFNNKTFNYIQRKNNILREFYNKTAKKDKNLHYVEGYEKIGSDMEGTMDGSHVTDLGFWRMTQYMYPIIKKIIN